MTQELSTMISNFHRRVADDLYGKLITAVKNSFHPEDEKEDFIFLIDKTVTAYKKEKFL